MKIGDKIRGIRTLKGLSQENMANIMDMSVRGYGDIERSEDIAMSRLEEVANKLGVSVTDILKFNDTISNFFDQCQNTNVNAGISPNQSNTTNNYDQRELQHQIEKLQLELKLCQAEKEKVGIEVQYWREKNNK